MPPNADTYPRNQFNIDIHRLMRELSDILSEQHGCKIVLTARKKEPDPRQLTNT